MIDEFDDDAILGHLDEVEKALQKLGRDTIFAFGLLCLERQWNFFVRVTTIATEYAADISPIRASLDATWDWVLAGALSGVRLFEPKAAGWDYAGRQASCSVFGLNFTQAVADLVSSVNSLDLDQPARCAARNLELIENLEDFADPDVLRELYKGEISCQLDDITHLGGSIRTEDLTRMRECAQTDSPFATAESLLT